MTPNTNPFTYLENSNVDIFGMFDPCFELDSIDSMFESNLDLSIPMLLPQNTENMIGLAGDKFSHTNKTPFQ